MPAIMLRGGSKRPVNLILVIYFAFFHIISQPLWRVLLACLALPAFEGIQNIATKSCDRPDFLGT